MSQAAWWRHLRGDPSRFLLDEAEPGAVWMTLTEVLGRPDDSPAVHRAREAARLRGRAAAVLAAQEEDGWWGSPVAYAARWGGSAWRLAAAAGLGADPQDPRAGRAVDALRRVLEPRQGGFSPGHGRPPSACFTAGLCEAMVRFGFAHDARVREAIAWLAERERDRGGWSCPDLRHLVGGGCAVAAGASLHLAARLGRGGQPVATVLAARAATWFLERGLFLSGPAPRGWFTFCHPEAGRTDLLDALYGMARCAVPPCPAIAAGVDRVLAAQEEGGVWCQGRQVPDGEPVREPSRWVTLKALVVISTYAGEEDDG